MAHEDLGAARGTYTSFLKQMKVGVIATIVVTVFVIWVIAT